MFVPVPDPTPEEQEAARKAQEQQEMAIRDFQHGYQRLFEELEEDQLTYLKTMFDIIVNHTNFPLAAAWQGMTTHALKTRFGICMSCGVNHEEEFQHEEDGHDSLLHSDFEGVTVSPPPSVADWNHAMGYDEPDDPLPPWEQVTAEERELMKQYHLDDVYDEDSHVLLHFVCTGINGMQMPCGMTYPTIQDRMIKEPENCPGCFQRMGHG